MSYPLPVVIEQDGNNEKAYDLYSRLLKDRIIFVGTPINDQVANAIIAQLLFLESDNADKDIFMYINTPGGAVTSGLGIYDTMRYVKPDIVTVCVGQAVSMGCFLLSGGTPGKRFSLPHTSIMMHMIRGGQQGPVPDVIIEHEEMIKKNDLLMGILAKNTGRPIAEIKNEFERDKWMTPTEAKDFGIIDEIHEQSKRTTSDE